MGTNLIRDASNRVKRSGMVIPVTLVFLAMFIVSCALMYEDYTTSRLGYEALPTRKANMWVIPLVALLPQLGQVGFAYVFMTDTSKRWAMVITVLLWSVDVLTDVYFKAQGLNLLWTGAATAETIVIYSIGSEIMLVTSVAMLIDLAGPFFEQMGKALQYVFGASRRQGSSRSSNQSNRQTFKQGNPTYRPPTQTQSKGKKLF